MKLDVIESQHAHLSTDQGLSFELAASYFEGSAPAQKSNVRRVSSNRRR